MNALTEPQVIDALYRASAAGVADRPRGARHLRIAARALPACRRTSACAPIVGRFLEHPRVWYFGNDGAEEVYLSSADWMERNFFRRVEVAFPLLDPALRRQMRDDLQLYLDDARDAWTLDAEGHYATRAARRSARPLGAAHAARALHRHGYDVNTRSRRPRARRKSISSLRSAAVSG
ncbi:MAG: hypothetical protein QM696_12085 [Steroidobacteraceae bacterium]